MNDSVLSSLILPVGIIMLSHSFTVTFTWDKESKEQNAGFGIPSRHTVDGNSCCHGGCSVTHHWKRKPPSRPAVPSMAPGLQALSQSLSGAWPLSFPSLVMTIFAESPQCLQKGRARSSLSSQSHSRQAIPVYSWAVCPVACPPGHRSSDLFHCDSQREIHITHTRAHVWECVRLAPSPYHMRGILRLSLLFLFCLKF